MHHSTLQQGMDSRKNRLAYSEIIWSKLA